MEFLMFCHLLLTPFYLIVSGLNRNLTIRILSGRCIYINNGVIFVYGSGNAISEMTRQARRSIR